MHKCESAKENRLAFTIWIFDAGANEMRSFRASGEPALVAPNHAVWHVPIDPVFVGCTAVWYQRRACGYCPGCGLALCFQRVAVGAHCCGVCNGVGPAVDQRHRVIYLVGRRQQHAAA